ncbi:MAG: insulinase family protein [Myxococcales bacterium]|nr:insulinase family protein [Myxococcales bacterium]
MKRSPNHNNLRASIALLACGAAALLFVACAKPVASKGLSLPSVGVSDAVAVAADDPWAGREDLIKPPEFAPLAAVALPPITQFKLPNGMKVLIVAKADAPVLSVQLAIANGWSADPADQPGLAAFVAQMLLRGTTKRDAAAFARAIAATGGSLASDASYEATVLKCDAQAAHLATCLSLMHEALAAPAFAPAEMPSVGERLAGQVQATEESAAAMAAVHAQNLLWSNDHPRGRVMSMASLRSISQGDLRAWHAAANRPERATLVVVGNVAAPSAKRTITAQFAGWRGQGRAVAPATAASPIANRTLRLIDMPGQAQAQIAVALPGIAHQDSRFFDTLVWNHVLGGGAGARLIRSLRSDGAGGGAPSATTTFDRNRERGAWVATAATRTSEAAATLTMLLREIKKMQSEGPSAGEVDEAVAYLGGSYGLRFETASAIASSLLAAELHDFDAAYVENFPVVLDKSDQASVAGAAAELLGTTSIAIAIVGDAAKIAPQLDKLKLTYERASIRDVVTPVARRELPEDPKLAAKARALLDAALAKKGGRAALAARKSLRLTASGAMKRSSQVVDVDITRLWSLPSDSRVDLVLNKSIRISYAMGAGGAWQDTPKGLVDVAAIDADTVERERWLDPDFILLRHLAPGAQVRWVGQEKVDGTTLTKVNVTSPDKRFTATLFVDDKTKLVTMVAFPEGAGVGTISLEDYKPIGGILVAHKRTTLGGDETVTLVISKFEWNVAVDPAQFKKPAVSANASPAMGRDADTTKETPGP